MREQTHKPKSETTESKPRPLAATIPNERDANPGTPAVPYPDPSKPLAEQDPAVLLAMCLFGEARGETGMARRAVAQVILNRANHPRALFGSRRGAAFADNLRSVILQPQQFSSLNPGDPNYTKILHPLEHERPEVWERCLHCAEDALRNRRRPDTLTLNSDHYFDDSIQPPAWADPAKRTVAIGRLRFYRLDLPLPQAPADSPQEAAAGAATGSRPRARVSAAHEPKAAANGPDTPAPGPQSSRPPMSLPAPKSPRAQMSGPGSYLRYGWSRGLSLLAIVGVSLLLTACNNFERTAYRVLAVTQAEYEATQQQVAEAAARGLITTEQWNRFQTEGNRFIAAHNAAVDALQVWIKSQSTNDSTRAQATLQVLPRLIQELNALVASFGVSQPPAPAPPATRPPATVSRTGRTSWR